MRLKRIERLRIVFEKGMNVIVTTLFEPVVCEKSYVVFAKVKSKKGARNYGGGCSVRLISMTEIEATREKQGRKSTYEIQLMEES